MNNWQHALMYAILAFSGAVDLIGLASEVPEGTEQVCCGGICGGSGGGGRGPVSKRQGRGAGSSRSERTPWRRPGYVGQATSL
jgi:hypothetical protein